MILNSCCVAELIIHFKGVDDHWHTIMNTLIDGCQAPMDYSAIRNGENVHLWSKWQAGNIVGQFAELIRVHPISQGNNYIPIRVDYGPCQFF